MQQGFHTNSYNLMQQYITCMINSIAFTNIGRRLIMLRGLPGINTESVQIIAPSW